MRTSGIKLKGQNDSEVRGEISDLRAGLRLQPSLPLGSFLPKNCHLPPIFKWCSIQPERTVPGSRPGCSITQRWLTLAPPADQARVRPRFLHERDGVIGSPGKRQPEGTEGGKEERPPGAVKGLRGWRSVRDALGAAEPASPPGSRSRVGPHC